MTDDDRRRYRELFGDDLFRPRDEWDADVHPESLRGKALALADSARSTLFDLIKTSRSRAAVEALAPILEAYIAAHPEDIEIAMEAESVATLLSAYRSGRLIEGRGSRARASLGR